MPWSHPLRRKPQGKNQSAGNGHPLGPFERGETSHFTQLIKDLRQWVAWPPTLFKATYEQSILNFYKVQRLPRKQALFWCVHTAFQAVRLRQSVILPVKVDAEIVMQQQEAWTFAVFISAIFYAHGRALGSEEPQEAALNRILPVDIIHWLKQSPGVWEAILSFLDSTGDASKHTYGHVIHEAYQFSEKARHQYRNASTQKLDTHEVSNNQLTDFLTWLAHHDFTQTSPDTNNISKAVIDTPEGKFLVLPDGVRQYAECAKGSTAPSLEALFKAWLEKHSVKFQRLAMPGQSTRLGVSITQIKHIVNSTDQSDSIR